MFIDLKQIQQNSLKGKKCCYVYGSCCERPCSFDFMELRECLLWNFLVGRLEFPSWHLEISWSKVELNAAYVYTLWSNGWFVELQVKCACWKYKWVLTNAPAVWGERRTHWENPWGDLSSDSWHRARRVSQSALCSGCSSLQTSVSPSTRKPAAQTGERVKPDIIRSDTGDRGHQVKEVKLVKTGKESSKGGRNNKYTHKPWAICPSMRTYFWLYCILKHQNSRKIEPGAHGKVILVWLVC